MNAKRTVSAKAIIHRSKPFDSSLQFTSFQARSREYAIKSTSTARSPVKGFMQIPIQ